MHSHHCRVSNYKNTMLPLLRSITEKNYSSRDLKAKNCETEIKMEQHGLYNKNRFLGKHNLLR